MDRGESQAAEELLPLADEELRRLAAAKMANEQGQTIQATALVHEAWLRLVGEGTAWKDRHHFIRAATEQVAHPRGSRPCSGTGLKRKGRHEHVPLEYLDVAVETDDERLIRIHELIQQLEELHPEQAELVKLRFFVGLRIADAAESMGIPGHRHHGRSPAPGF